MTMSKCIDIRTGKIYAYYKGSKCLFWNWYKTIKANGENNDGSYSLKFGNRFMICRPRFEMYLNDLMSKETTFTENDQEE